MLAARLISDRHLTKWEKNVGIINTQTVNRGIRMHVLRRSTSVSESKESNKGFVGQQQQQLKNTRFEPKTNKHKNIDFRFDIDQEQTQTM